MTEDRDLVPRELLTELNRECDRLASRLDTAEDDAIEARRAARVQLQRAEVQAALLRRWQNRWVNGDTNDGIDLERDTRAALTGEPPTTCTCDGRLTVCDGTSCTWPSGWPGHTVPTEEDR